jgi:hypothetical protein
MANPSTPRAASLIARCENAAQPAWLAAGHRSASDRRDPRLTRDVWAPIWLPARQKSFPEPRPRAGPRRQAIRPALSNRAVRSPASASLHISDADFRATTMQRSSFAMLD